MGMVIKDLKPEKGMYQEAREKGMDFGQLLESLDKENEYTGELATMTAFERQLALNDVKVKGPSADVLQKFFATSTVTALFPFYVDSQIKAGIMQGSITQYLCSATTNINSHVYQRLMMTDTEPDRQLHNVAEGAELPTTTISYASQNVTLCKFGRQLRASYEAIRLQKLDMFGLMLQRIGAQIGIDESDWAIGIILFGDGNANPLVETDTDVSGTIDYDDMTKLWIAFARGYQMNNIIVGDALLRRILNLNEFKDPDAGFSFQRTGELMSPLGCRMTRWSSLAVLPDDYVLGVDQRYGLEQLVELGTMTETDDLITHQLHRATVSRWSGFAKSFDHAFEALEETH